MRLSESGPDSALLADSAGLFASIACAIHCAAMPLVIGYLPLLGLGWLADASFHQVMAVVCFALAVSAFLPGWRTHRSLTPGVVGIAGVGLLSLAAFGLEGSCCPTCAVIEEPQPPVSACADASCPSCAAAEPQPTLTQAEPRPVIAWATPLVTPLGGLLLVAGHLTNHKKLCGCRHGHCRHERAEPDHPASPDDRGPATV